MTKKQIILLLVCAIGAAFLFNWANVPVAWLTGSMAVGIASAVIRGGTQKLPATFGVLGQVIIGLATAARFPLQTMELATTHAGPLLLIVLDLLQKSVFSCRGEAFASGFIGEIRVFIRKCFALLGFMQEVY